MLARICVPGGAHTAPVPSTRDSESIDRPTKTACASLCPGRYQTHRAGTTTTLICRRARLAGIHDPSHVRALPPGHTRRQAQRPRRDPAPGLCGALDAAAWLRHSPYCSLPACRRSCHRSRSRRRFALSSAGPGQRCAALTWPASTPSSASAVNVWRRDLGRCGHSPRRSHARRWRCICRRLGLGGVG